MQAKRATELQRRSYSRTTKLRLEDLVSFPFYLVKKKIIKDLVSFNRMFQQKLKSFNSVSTLSGLVQKQVFKPDGKINIDQR